MSDEAAALLHAIRTQPDEDTPRLIYADWLGRKRCETMCIATVPSSFASRLSWNG